jgi:hypothetical protein
MARALLQQPLIQSAVSSIKTRSERQVNLNHLTATFVDPGITVRLENDNNQILYGRRGTGKTHVLKMLERRARELGHLPVYIDINKLGSAAMFNETTRPAHLRALSLFRDMLAEVNNQILDYATSPQTDPPGLVFERLGDLATAMLRSLIVDDTVDYETAASTSDDRGMVTALSVGHTPSLSMRAQTGHSSESATNVGVKGHRMPWLSFQELNDALRSVLDASGITRVVILIDEWVGVPYDIQPLVAEFIKRSFFAEPRVTTKIGSIEYRSNFSSSLDHNIVLGFELGADVWSALELDDYFVYDRNTDKTVSMFGELLFRHIATEVEVESLRRNLQKNLPQRDGPVEIDSIVRSVLQQVQTGGRHFAHEYDVASSDELMHKLFGNRDAFIELVRAGEGVVRDFINIFSGAFFNAVRRDESKIGISAVRDAAREWYEQDKAPNVTALQRVVLQQITDEVIGQRKTRSFLLEKEYEQTDIIRSLFDFRLLHLVHRGYVDEAHPGKRYNVYALDFGAYVELLGTPRAPERDLRDRDEIKSDDVIMPFDDRRAMRRVILRPELLSG